MIVSKSSWHYRLALYTYGEYYGRSFTTVSLCKYFWSIVAAVVFYPLVRLMKWRNARPSKVSDLTDDYEKWKEERDNPKPKKVKKEVISDETAEKLVKYVGVAGLSVGLTVSFMINWVNTLIFLGVIGFFIGFIFGVAALAEKIGDWNYERRSRRPHVEKAPKKPREYTTLKLIWAFFMAKKKKACPLLQFEDPNERRE